MSDESRGFTVPVMLYNERRKKITDSWGSRKLTWYWMLNSNQFPLVKVMKLPATFEVSQNSKK